MAQLQSECLCKLASETEGTIQLALSRGMTLKDLLDMNTKAEDTEAEATLASNVVQVVFSHVLKDKEPPETLVKLVVDCLSRFLDPELWAQLEIMVNHATSRLLIKAMLERRQFKSEASEGGSVKSECSTGNDSAPVPPNRQSEA